MDEERRVAAARHGDRDAFRPLVEAYARPLFALCVRITLDAALAEDAVQEALFNAYRHLRDFDGRSSFKTWLYRIAVNAALEQMRKQDRHRVEVADDTDDEDNTLAEQHAAESPGPEAHAHGGEIASRVDAELARMTLLERTAFTLRHAEGCSIEDIATALSMNSSACKQAIFRAVRKLRHALQGIR